eukprot:654255-Alexandrium_andersonii.AAC.1
MYRSEGLSPLTFPHELKDQAYYEASCQACEVEVTLSKTEHSKVRGALAYDLRKDGSHGRALKVDVCGVCKGDRLEPS